MNKTIRIESTNDLTAKHVTSISKAMTAAEVKNAERLATAIEKGRTSYASAAYVQYDAVQLLSGGYALFVNRSTSSVRTAVIDGKNYRETRYSCVIGFAKTFEEAEKITANGIIGKVTIAVVDGKITALAGAKMSVSSIAKALKIGGRFCPSYRKAEAVKG